MKLASLFFCVACGGSGPNDFFDKDPSAGAGSGGRTGTGGTAHSGGSAANATGGTGSGTTAGSGGSSGGGGSGVIAECGNGIVDQPSEECDDGDTDAAAGCDSSCQVDCTRYHASAIEDSTRHSCYLLIEEPVIWMLARQGCETVGAHLATLTSSEENQFVSNQLPTYTKWIGATDNYARSNPEVGTYVWITGEAFDYAAWRTGEPDAAPVQCPGREECYEHCAAQEENSALWNDRLCDMLLPYVCEWDAPGR